jgi:hypothetical protein
MLEQVTAFRPFMRELIIRALIARMTRNYKIRWVIRATATSWHNMIDVVTSAKFLRAVVALALLPCVLNTNILRCMGARNGLLAGASIAYFRTTMFLDIFQLSILSTTDTCNGFCLLSLCIGSLLSKQDIFLQLITLFVISIFLFSMLFSVALNFLNNTCAIALIIMLLALRHAFFTSVVKAKWLVTVSGEIFRGKVKITFAIRAASLYTITHDKNQPFLSSWPRGVSALARLSSFWVYYTINWLLVLAYGHFEIKELLFKAPL